MSYKECLIFIAYIKYLRTFNGPRNCSVGDIYKEQPVAAVHQVLSPRLCLKNHIALAPAATLVGRKVS